MAFDAGGAANLEQFTLLAKNARGRACVALVQQVLSNKKLFVFRELLDMPNVEALQNTENHGYYELLRIFCFGTYSDYLARKDELPSLTPQQVQKLRKLTVVSLAHRYKLVPYDVLLEALDVATVRELEDILIEAIYSGLVQGKLDQKTRAFVVKYAVGRDTQNDDIDDMIAKLLSWKTESTAICDSIDDILRSADTLAENDNARDEALITKLAGRTGSDRAKLFAGGGVAGFRPSSSGDNFSGVYGDTASYNPRRGQSGNKRMHGMGRKGRM